MPDVTSRGFRIFMSRERSDEEWLYGKPATVSVVESSLAMRGPHVRIYEGDDGVQLSLLEARAVADALALFCAEAEAGELTEVPE